MISLKVLSPKFMGALMIDIMLIVFASFILFQLGIFPSQSVAAFNGFTISFAIIYSVFHIVFEMIGVG